MPPPDAAARPEGAASHWLAEAVRLREAHWGPLEDADAVRQARLAGGTLVSRILLRAHLLARREGLDVLLGRWRQGAALTFILLVLATLLAGAGAALGALGDGSRPVNVLWAGSALLGLHALMFVLWLATFAIRRTGATGLGRLWLWTTRKLARGPDSALVPQALLNLLARAGALRWLFGAASHLLWLAALCAALAVLLAMLSTASYRFVWATTLLQPDTFVRLVAALGWLPAQLGFSTPDPAMVRASDGVQALPAGAQAQWAVWLLGLVVCYGIVPRLLAGLVCMIMAARALRRLRIEPELPGYAALRDRLQPPAESIGLDQPAGPLRTPAVVAAQALPDLAGHAVLAGIELPPGTPWPPEPLPEQAHDAGILDTREQRNALLDALARSAAPRLLLACDAHQTPDRGTLALIADLSGKAAQTRVWLSAGFDDPASADRSATWRARLQEAGLPPEAILADSDAPLQWLASTAQA
ncbi:DUF2868 domain-containing protein [Bordetella genomosp. 13]|uniref:DUF2868 domain-containing protein n=1 Tax=Bordetella genomosp. 13 TaxID=463040 RepID=UPI0011A77312|nr:DUF2868 domain-containing protein [Bordetella genomosp. 13]